MADPSIPFVNVAANNTFQNWVNITNNLVADMVSFVITANSTGALTTGNAYVNGAVSALEFLTPTLSGGNLSSAANLAIVTNVAIGNTTANVFLGFGQINVDANVGVNSTAFFVGNSTVNAVVNSSALATASAKLTTSVNVGANVNLGTAAISVGNTTANLLANSILMQVANSTATANHTSTGFYIGTLVANSTGIYEGATGVVSVGNSTVNVFINSSSVTQNGSPLGNVFVQVSGTPVGNAATVNFVPGGATNISGTMNAGVINVVITSTGGGGGSSPGGTNTNIQFDDSGILGGSSGFNFNKTTNVVTLSNTLSVGSNVNLTTVVLSVGNTTANLLANSILVQVTNSSGTTNVTPAGLITGAVTVNSSAVAVGANVTLNAIAIELGNTTVSTFANSSFIQTSNATASANITAAGFAAGLTVANATGVFVGANVSVGPTNILAGNSTVNLVVNSTIVYLSNIALLTNNALSFGNTIANVSIGNTASGFAAFFGNATVNAQYNSSVVSLANSTITTNVGLSGLTIGANVAVNSSAVSVGNSTVNAQVNSIVLSVASALHANAVLSANLTVGNSTINTFVNSSSLVLGSVSLNTIGMSINSVPSAFSQVIHEFYGGL